MSEPRDAGAANPPTHDASAPDASVAADGCQGASGQRPDPQFTPQQPIERCPGACPERTLCAQCAGQCVQIQADDDAGTPAFCCPDQCPSGCGGGACEPVRSIAAGAFQTCVSFEKGTVKCWGGFTLGVCEEWRARPTLIEGLSSVRSVSVGELHACALLESGSTKCWGDSDYGQLGHPGTLASRHPVEALVGAELAAVSAAYLYNCALLVDGGVGCWGGSFVPEEAAMRRVPGLSDVKQLDGEDIAQCATLHDGHVKCWVMQNEVIPGPRVDWAGPFSAPLTIAHVEHATSVAVGGTHACALIDDGSVRCWGDNESAELGVIGAAASHAGREVPGVADAIAIAAGASSTCAVLADGGVICWGLNEHMQLGNGTSRSPMEPTRVVALDDVVQIASGWKHYCAVTRTNSVRCWGFGNDFQLGNGDRRFAAAPVVVRFAD